MPPSHHPCRHHTQCPHLLPRAPCAPTSPLAPPCPAPLRWYEDTTTRNDSLAAYGYSYDNPNPGTSLLLLKSNWLTNDDAMLHTTYIKLRLDRCVDAGAALAVAKPGCPPQHSGISRPVPAVDQSSPGTLHHAKP